MIGCKCGVCLSTDPRDERSRASILIEQRGAKILIDTSVDFRTQALRAGIDRLDAVVLTHSHADHLHGLDDTRTLSRDQPLPLYAAPITMAEVRTRFDYIFKSTQKGGGKPNIDLIELDGEETTIAGVGILPVRVKHGELDIYGYRLGRFAYLTDCSEIPPESHRLLDGVDNLVLGALRYRPHATHFSIEEAISAAETIGASSVWFTHLCHDVSHVKLTNELLERGGNGPRFRPAYDGLEIEL